MRERVWDNRDSEREGILIALGKSKVEGNCVGLGRGGETDQIWPKLLRKNAHKFSRMTFPSYADHSFL